MTSRVLAMLFVVVLATCPLRAQSEPSSAKHETAAASAKIEGAGSTTINPLFRAWIDEYTRLHSGFQMSYTAIGSRGGFRMLASGTAFFAATDVPISDDQLAQANGRILQLPIGGWRTLSRSRTQISWGALPFRGFCERVGPGDATFPILNSLQLFSAGSFSSTEFLK